MTLGSLGLLPAQTVGKAGIGMFAVVVLIPESHRLVGTPSTACRAIGCTPLGDTPLLCYRNNREILLDDPLVVVGHSVMLLLGNIGSNDILAVLIKLYSVVFD